MGGNEELEERDISLSEALQLLTGLSQDELHSRQLGEADLEGTIDERTGSMKRVYTALVDPSADGRVVRIAMSEEVAI